MVNDLPLARVTALREVTAEPDLPRRPAPETPASGLDDALLQTLCDEVAAGSISLVTSDVFDTIAFRPTVTPVAVFEQIGESFFARGMLQERITPQAFGRLRAVAERKARVRRHAEFGDPEVSSHEIYRELTAVLASGVTPADAVEVEVEVERDVLVPNLDVVAALTWVADQGVPVIAVSDSYFSADQIRALFAQPVLEDLVLEQIVTSSDRRRNKGGGLLEELIGELGIATSRLAHIGDHPESDVIVATRVGARPVHLDRHPPELRAIVAGEQRFGERRVIGLQEQYDAGTGAIRSQLLRSPEHAALSPTLASYWRWGATVLGPILTGFAEWVHLRLADLDANRVWCPMREGPFLAQFLAGAIEQSEREIDIRTLWLNRAVCGRAALTDITRASLLRAAGMRRTPTAEELLKCVGLRVSDVPGLSSHAGTAVDDHVVQELLFDTLIEDGALRARALAGAALMRERVCAMLRRELEGASRLTLVDVGWGGSVPALLREACADAGFDIEVRGLYLVTNESAAERVLDGAKIEGFLGDLNLPEPLLGWFGRSPEIIEQACMSDHGPQIDIDEQLDPVLGEQLIPQAQREQIKAAQHGALAFQRRWVRYRGALPGKLRALSGQPALLRAMLVRATVAPTEREAAVLGSWLHDERQGSVSRIERLADADDGARLRYVAPDELASLPNSEVYWPYALAALADPETAELVGLTHEGRLSPDALSRAVETGPFVIRVAAGAGSDAPTASCVIEPRRNRFGLTLVRGLVIANHIVTLELAPSTAPLLARVDWIDLRLYAQGLGEPIVVRMEQTEELRRLEYANCTLVAPNLVISYTGDAAWRLDLTTVTDRIVHRVDVECGLAMLPIAPIVRKGDVLVTLDTLDQIQEIERVRSILDSVLASPSWRITRPFRALKRLLRG
jgi:FMN phosphatase YigB (HAD superfamily)